MKIVIQTRTDSKAKNPPPGFWDAVLSRVLAARPDVEFVMAGDAAEVLYQMGSGYFVAAVGIDSWLLHAAAAKGLPAVGVWGPSDPRLFGRAGHVACCNRQGLRPDQLGIWHGVSSPGPSGWPLPAEVAAATLIMIEGISP